MQSESKYDRVKKWLQTRQHLYSALEYDDIVPLEMPEEVTEKLSTQVGTLTQLLENTPYPILQVENPKYFNLEKVKSILTPHSLTAYKGPPYWYSEKYGSGDSIIITPRVSSVIVEKLNYELNMTPQQEDYYTPCFKWAVNLEPNAAEKLLGRIKVVLEEYP